jgi:hypothetical protein
LKALKMANNECVQPKRGHTRVQWIMVLIGEYLNKKMIEEEADGTVSA